MSFRAFCSSLTEVGGETAPPKRFGTSDCAPGPAGAQALWQNFRVGRRYTWARVSMALTISAIASATGTPFFCEPSRKRNDTAPAARSSSPAMST